MGTKYQVVALIGKAGAGKDTIQSFTCAAHPDIFNSIVSYTTRPAREGEEDGINYYFLSIEDFTRKVLNGEMLEATEFRNWFYGTSIDALVPDKINLGVFNPAGIMALLESSEINLTIIYVHASDKERLMRYLKREEHPDCAEMCRRFFTDEEDFSDLEFDYYLLDNCDNSCTDLVNTGHSLNIVLERVWNQLGRKEPWQEISTRPNSIMTTSNEKEDNNK